MIRACASPVVAAVHLLPKTAIHSRLLEAMHCAAITENSAKRSTGNGCLYCGGTSSQILASMPRLLINCLTSSRKTASTVGGWQSVNRQESLTGESIDS